METLFILGVVLVAALPVNAVAFWLGTRAGAAGVARDELMARRRRPRCIVGAPRHLIHMATTRIDGYVAGAAKEAFAILRDESPLAPTADHLAALAIYHADAVGQYDALGDQLIVVRRQLREAQAARNQLAQFIRREIGAAAAADEPTVLTTSSRLTVSGAPGHA
jgi:hypothetical protein